MTTAKKPSQWFTLQMIHTKLHVSKWDTQAETYFNPKIILFSSDNSWQKMWHLYSEDFSKIQRLFQALPMRAVHNLTRVIRMKWPLQWGTSNVGNKYKATAVWDPHKLGLCSWTNCLHFTDVNPHREGDMHGCMHIHRLTHLCQGIDHWEQMFIESCICSIKETEHQWRSCWNC